VNEEVVLGMSFTHLVTGPVVKAGVRQFVSLLRMWQEASESDRDGGYAKTHPDAYSSFANDSTRFALWDYWLKDGTSRVGCSYRYDGCEGLSREPKLAEWRKRLFQEARAYLGMSSNLWPFYLEHRQDVLDQIVSLQAQSEVRRYLVSVKPYFSDEIHVDLQQAETAYQGARAQAMKAMKGCACSENWARGIGGADVSDADGCPFGKKELASYRSAEANLAKLAPDWKAFQWVNRRRSEGTVLEWNRIIEDLIGHL